MHVWIIVTMIYSWLARSSCSASRTNVVSGNRCVRRVASEELVSPNACTDWGLGLVRGYLTLIGAGTGKLPIPKVCLSEFNPIFVKPGHRRLFCSQAPKKRRESSSGDHKNLQENFMKQYQSIFTLLFFIAFVLSSIFGNPHEHKQISFQEFKNKLLEPGLVDHIVVANKSVAKVYMKGFPSVTYQTNDWAVQVPTDGVSQYKYYFNIGSVDSFEEKLEEAQEALGIGPHNL